MPDPRWPPAEALLAYFICAMDWAVGEFVNIAVHQANIYTVTIRLTRYSMAQLCDSSPAVHHSQLLCNTMLAQCYGSVSIHVCLPEVGVCSIKTAKQDSDFLMPHLGEILTGYPNGSKYAGEGMINQQSTNTLLYLKWFLVFLFSRPKNLLTLEPKSHKYFYAV